MAKQSRFLTYLFCDLVGSTELTRDHEPEDAFELIVGFQDACRQYIERFQGYVACYMGDGVMGYFGYPIAMESSAEAAIRCALELARHVKSLPEPLSMRVGIANGWGVIGEVRVGGHVVEVATVSEAANLAARLETSAEPDEILVSDEVYREVEGLFSFHPPRELALKGFAGVQRGYPVAGYGEFRSPSHRQAERQASALVGRDAQLHELAGLWERTVTEQRGSHALVRGPAGIGKSTLLRNLRARVNRDRERRITVYASRFEEHTAFHPFRTWLEELTAERSQAYLHPRIAELMPPEDATLAREAIDVLLGLAPQPAWPPKLLRERICTALVKIVLGMSRERPLMLLIEDLHWLDPSSLEIVARLKEACASHALMLVASSRPRPGTEGTAWEHGLDLGQLSADEVQSLIGALDGAHRLPAEARREIAQKAEGIPLLLREFTLATLAADAQGQIVIPDSLLESFGARLDAQTQDLDLIGAAAAVGEAFAPALLAQALRRTEEEVEAALQSMRTAELLMAYNGPQGRVYDFSHALLRDAAYRSLLRQQRHDLHRKILAANRAMDAEWDRTQPMQAAHHLQAVDAHVEAVTVLLDAARLRFAASQFPESSGLVSKALVLLANIGDEQQRLGLELQLQTLLGLTLTQVKGFGEPEANQAYTRAWSICGQLQRTGEPEFCAIWGIWAHKLVVSDTVLSRTLTEHLDRIAHDMQRADLALLARTASVTTGLCVADFATVPEHLDAVLQAYDAAQHGGLALSYSMDPKALSLLFAAHAFSICGDTARAAWARDQAIAHVQTLGYEFLVPYATIFGWGSALYHGADESVLAVLDQAMAQAERLALPFWVVSGMMWKGVALYHLGRYAEADGYLRPGLDIAGAIGLNLVIPYLRAVHASVLARLGQVDTALPLFEQALAHARGTGENFARAEIHRLYAEALIAIGGEGIAEARCQLIHAHDVAECQGAQGWMTRIAATRAQLEKRLIESSTEPG